MAWPYGNALCEPVSEAHIYTRQPRIGWMWWCIDTAQYLTESMNRHHVASFFVLSSMYECMLADRVCVCACSNMSGKSLGDVWCRVCDILGARTLMTSVWFVWVRSIWGQFLRRLTALIVRNSISASWALIQFSSLQWESNPCNQSQRQDTQTCRESFIIDPGGGVVVFLGLDDVYPALFALNILKCFAFI